MKMSKEFSVWFVTYREALEHNSGWTINENERAMCWQAWQAGRASLQSMDAQSVKFREEVAKFSASEVPHPSKFLEEKGDPSDSDG